MSDWQGRILPVSAGLGFIGDRPQVHGIPEEELAAIMGSFWNSKLTENPEP